MLITKREFHCESCGGIKTLKKDEKEPDICPFCGIDKIGKKHWTSEWTKKEA